MTDILHWIENWYNENCNGDWEHNYGIKIDTIDNPGWAIMIDLIDTQYAGRKIEKMSVENNQDDWYVYSIEDSKFKAYSSPNRLEFLLETFKELITQE